MGLDLRQLKALRAIARYGGFSRASSEVNLTQPTLSTHIKNLEDHLGIRLLDRTGRVVTLTPAGELFLGYATRILDLCDQSIQAIEAYLGEIKGDVTIESSTVPGEYILPRWLGAFHRDYPGVRVSISVSDSRTAAERIAEGASQVGVTGTPPSGTSLTSRLLCRDEIILAASPEFIRRENIPGNITPGDLAVMPLIDREPGSGTRNTVEKALRDVGINCANLDWIATLSTTRSVIEGALSGVAAAFVSKDAIRRELEDGSLEEIKVNDLTIRRGFHVITHSSRSLSPVAEKIVDHLIENHVDRGNGLERS